MVKAAKSGVRTPAVIEVDQAAASIVMEYIAGETVKNVLNDNPTPSVVQWLCAEIGRYVALVHAQNIVHGDLTTSNMMVIRRELNDVQDYRQLVLIDFGLSFDSASAEDKAVDLYVLERALLSTHSDLPEMVSTELLILLTIKADEIMKSYTLHCKKKEVIGRLETGGTKCYQKLCLTSCSEKARQEERHVRIKRIFNMPSILHPSQTTTHP